MHVEIDGEFYGVNETTGDRYSITFSPGSRKTGGRIDGTCWDGNGNIQWTISGI